MTTMTVSEIADAAGTSADTVRYYERIGLLPEPARSPAGYRLYEAPAIDRLRFIKRAQRFGLRLEEVGELLDIRDNGLCPCGHARDLLSRRVAEIDGEIRGLQRLRDDIERMLADGPGGSAAEWPCAPGLLRIEDRTGRARPTATTTEGPNDG